MENKLELAPLKRALGMSTHALFQMKVSCNGKRENPVCETGLQGLFYVTYNLVLDAMRVTVETQQDKIDAALNTFEDLKRERKNMTLIEYVDHVYTLGTKVESYLWDTTS
ncbi:hypothetical protein Q1695_005124 [Nippostrongylus brasiliensis]|nr:hypothetical protein Q1695_005124 [Nippostrongylus brasiliensis]